MAYDESLAQMFRDDLSGKDGITEKKMFGGLCFMLNNHMLCCVHNDGVMYRIGKQNETAAISIEGAHPLGFTGRKMRGMVEVDVDAYMEDAKRAAWLDLALTYVLCLPEKE